jgi:azurin
MKRLLFVPAMATVLFLASCGGGNESSEKTAPATDTSATTAPAEEAPGADIPGIDTVKVTDHIKIDGQDDMKYDATLFKIKAGQDVKLTLKNIGKLPKEAMSHNVVILAQGTDVQAFGEAAVAAKPDHIPPAMASDVIAHTKLLGPGESDNITFKIADPGVYDFICSFPGHFGTMKGKIVVEK